MKTFKPKKSKSEIERIKEVFLSGKSIKIDGRGFVEITEDKYRNVNESNLSSFTSSCVYDAMSELRKEGYIINSQSCQGSGCCQYHANSYWLVGEWE